MPGPVKSLHQLSKDVLIKYVDTIDDVGDMEYRLLRPILMKITSPSQLKKLEKNSPQIAGEDAELWTKLIRRDFGEVAVSKYTPQNPKSWYKIYDKHQLEATKADTAAADALRAKFSTLNSSKASHKTLIVTDNRSLPPTNRRPRTTGESNWGKSAGNWTVNAGSKTKNVIAKARKEAKELSIFQGQRSKLAVPTHALKRSEVSGVLKEKIRTKYVHEQGPPSATAAPAVASSSSNKRKAEEQPAKEIDEKTKKWMQQGGGGALGAKRIAMPTLGKRPATAVRPESSIFMPKKPRRRE